MNEEILALCGAMGAGEDQKELLLPLVQAVRERLEGRLREGVAAEDCGPAFLLAAAMVVMDRLAGMTGGGVVGEITSFTAGELTIRKEAGSGGSGGKSLSHQAEELLAPWLGDTGFCFRGVEG